MRHSVMHHSINCLGPARSRRCVSSAQPARSSVINHVIHLGCRHCSSAQEEFAALHACKNGTERVVLCTMWLRAVLATGAKDGVLYNFSFAKMDGVINDMTALFQAGCRLCFVPMPFPYAQVCHNLPTFPTRFQRFQYVFNTFNTFSTFSICSLH